MDPGETVFKKGRFAYSWRSGVTIKDASGGAESLIIREPRAGSVCGWDYSNLSFSLSLSIVFVKREKLQFVSEARAGFECHRTGKKLRGCVPVTTRIVNDRIRTQPRFEKGYNEPETRYIETITPSPLLRRTGWNVENSCFILLSNLLSLVKRSKDIHNLRNIRKYNFDQLFWILWNSKKDDI